MSFMESMMQVFLRSDGPRRLAKALLKILARKLLLTSHKRLRRKKAKMLKLMTPST